MICEVVFAAAALVGIHVAKEVSPCFMLQISQRLYGFAGFAVHHEEARAWSGLKTVVLERHRAHQSVLKADRQGAELPNKKLHHGIIPEGCLRPCAHQHCRRSEVQRHQHWMIPTVQV